MYCKFTPSLNIFKPDSMRGPILKTILITVTALIISCTNKNAPDLVLVNGKVWTGESDSTFVEAIAIKENKIVAVGSTDEILKLSDSKTNRIDLNGKLVTAGFNDAHIHFLSGSLGLTEVDLLGTTSAAEVAQRVNQFIEKNPGKEWITGRGWQYTSFENGLPDSKALSAISNEVAVFIKAYDGHSGWANKKALQLAGVDGNTKYAGFGEIVKDKKGELTGTFRESAMGLVSKHIPEPYTIRKTGCAEKGNDASRIVGHYQCAECERHS
jgi:predicted amidohydrolase YtcJ